VLLLRFLGGSEDLPHARGIDCDRLLHEHVLALLDCLLEVNRTEAGRRGENRDVAERERLLVGIESHETPILRHVDAVRKAPGELLVRAFETIFESVRHRDQLDRPTAHAERLCSSTRTTAAASDERDLDRVVRRLAKGKSFRRETGEHCAACSDTGGTEEGPPRQRTRFNDVGGFVHCRELRGESSGGYAPD